MKAHFNVMRCAPSSMSHHLIVVEGFACPSDPRSYVVGGFMPLEGSPMANRSLGEGPDKVWLTNDLYDEQKQWSKVSLARTRVTGAPLWSQAWRWGSEASAWWPGLCPWGPAGLSPKGKHGPPLPWIHRLQEGP